MMKISKPAVGWNLEQTANDEYFYNKQQTMKISKLVVGTWNKQQTMNISKTCGWNLEQAETMKISKPAVGWNLEQTAND